MAPAWLQPASAWPQHGSSMAPAWHQLGFSMTSAPAGSLGPLPSPLVIAAPQRAQVQVVVCTLIPAPLHQPRPTPPQALTALPFQCST
eukprot:6267107-Prymnesium_polylepis.1